MSDPGLQGFPQNTAQLVGPGGQITVPWMRLLQTLWRRSGTATGANVNQPGTISAFGMLTPPSGWLLCDGTAYSRVIYAALYNEIGTYWGAGDGSTTFNVPPLQGRVLVGYGTSFPFASRGGAIPTTLGTLGYAAVTFAIKT